MKMKPIPCFYTFNCSLFKNFIPVLRIANIIVFQYHWIATYAVSGNQKYPNIVSTKINSEKFIFKCVSCYMILTEDKKETTILPTNLLPSTKKIYLHSEKSVAYSFFREYIMVC